MQLLVHVHGLFDQVVVQVQGFGLVELLVQNRQLGLHLVVLESLALGSLPGLFQLLNELVDFVQVSGLRNVAYANNAPRAA